MMTVHGGTPPGNRTIRLLIQYDGRPFHGWQVQPEKETVQGLLEGAIGRVTGRGVTLKGSGRTDAGVHALGQVACFTTDSPISCADLARAVNSLVPRSVAVLEAREAPSSFDARYSALSKTYRYRLLLRRCRSPLDEGLLWHIPYPLNLAPLRRAAASLAGRRDFSSFRSAGCASRSAVRTMKNVAVRRRGDRVDIELEADGFLRHMVRAIVGTLVETGRGRFHADDMSGILAARDRSRAGPTAPPGGLYLVAVHYPPPITWTGFPGRDRP